jgi:ribonuclease T2
MKRVGVFAVIAILALFIPNSASASVKLEGWLIAGEACIASRSLRGSSGEKLEEGRAYILLGKNRADAPSHYQIRLDPEGSDDRWVRIDCGIHVIRADGQDPEPEVSTPGGDEDGKVASRKTHLLLSVSWQAAFCETHAKTRECRSQRDDRFDAAHFSLHGLWPQPLENVYCGVSARMKRDDENRQWDWLPVLDLERATRMELEKVMPGTQSFLHRHEWVKHGTCYSPDAQTYYRDSLRLMDQLNSSDVQALFVANVGQNVSLKDIREAFERSFGRGAGQRVRISCTNDGDRRLISELKIHLGGPLGEDRSFVDALRAGEKTAAGCSGGIVDPVGLQ